MNKNLKDSLPTLSKSEVEIFRNQIESGFVICEDCKEPMTALMTREGDIHKLICIEGHQDHPIYGGKIKTLAVLSRVWVR